MSVAIFAGAGWAALEAERRRRDAAMRYSQRLREAIENQQADSPVAQRREQLAEQAAEAYEDDWKTWQMGKDW